MERRAASGATERQDQKRKQSDHGNGAAQPPNGVLPRNRVNVAHCAGTPGKTGKMWGWNATASIPIVAGPSGFLLPHLRRRAAS